MDLQFGEGTIMPIPTDARPPCVLRELCTVEANRQSTASPSN